MSRSMASICEAVIHTGADHGCAGLKLRARQQITAAAAAAALESCHRCTARDTHDVFVFFVSSFWSQDQDAMLLVMCCHHCTPHKPKCKSYQNKEKGSRPSPAQGEEEHNTKKQKPVALEGPVVVLFRLNVAGILCRLSSCTPGLLVLAPLWVLFRFLVGGGSVQTCPRIRHKISASLDRVS